jgi:hypothetical protein
VVDVDFKEENKGRINEVRTKMVYPTSKFSFPIIAKEEVMPYGGKSLPQESIT